MQRTSTAEIALLDSGIVRTRIDRGAVQSMDHARENLHGSIEACGGQKRPILVDIAHCQPLEPEVRHFYSGKLLTESFLALALLVEASAFGRMMGNVYLLVSRPEVPTKLFSNEEEALKWLCGFLK